MSLLIPETGLLFWMTLAFLAVFFILAKFAFPVITGAVDKRTKSIEDSMEAARHAEVKLASFREEADGIIASANTKRNSILDEAREARKKVLDEAREEAEKLIARKTAQAELEIGEMRQKALDEARDQIVDLSIKIAEKVIGEKLNDGDKQKMLIEQYLKEQAIRKS